MFMFSILIFNSFTQKTDIPATFIFSAPQDSADPVLVDETVWPITGNQDTEFIFQVNYSDLDNDQPAFARVVINSTQYGMTKLYPADDDYRDGCIYRYSTRLAPGNYTTYFWFSDGVTTVQTATILAPNVTYVNQNPPEIKYPRVTPSKGDSSINYNFSVWYFDEDNNLPIFANISIDGGAERLLIEADPTDVNCVDGKEYYYETPIITAGTHEFNIKFYDGVYAVSTSNLTGPEVDPFYQVGAPNLLQPANDSTLPNGSIYFRWSDMNLPCGAVNYTWELSDDSSFSTILDQVNDIPELASYGELTQAINYTQGTYYWRVRPTFRTSSGYLYRGEWSSPFIIRLTSNEHAPSLSSALLSPVNGTQNSIFTFQVTYTDLDNNQPVSINVLINGSAHAMNKLYPEDSDYTDGCIYRYTTMLSAGTYNYSFECNDGLYSANTSVYSGPNVQFQNDNLPEIRYPSVNPMIGNSGNVYTFSVWYYDADNNTAINANVTIDSTTTYNLIPLDPMDDNVVDGKGYFVKLSFTNSTEMATPGVHSHYFSFYDGMYSVSTDLFSGPEVDPFLNVNGPVLLNPANGSTVLNGSINFQWLSLDLPCGPVNYTWQFSNSKTFSTILTQIHDVPESVLVTTLTQTINNPAGTYYWRVRPTWTAAGSSYSGTWSEVNIIFIQHNDNAPELSNICVVPTAGNQKDIFNFSVVYRDVDNNTPIYVRVFINSTPHLMSKLYPADNNYIDGSVYQYSTVLGTPGSYEYYLDCSDGSFTSNTSLFTDLSVSYENEHAPGYFGAKVSPHEGRNNTNFNFSIYYYDLDNDPPLQHDVIIDGSSFSMTQVDPADDNYVDGALFYYATTLDWGVHNFSFEFSDANFTATTPVFEGPWVNPFYTGVPGDTTLIIFQDDFEDGSFDSDWTLTGFGGVTTQIANSGNYSANHHGNAGAVTSRVIPLNGFVWVNISYWVCRGSDSFSENPDTGENLVVEYYNSSGAWVMLDLFPGNGQPGETFESCHTLPSDALHDNFMVRFRQTSGSGSPFDYWHFDDVLIYAYSIKPSLINPLNLTRVNQGLVDFTWTNFNTKIIPPVNFTWQLSNKIDFSTVISEVSNIPEASGSISNYTANITNPPGVYYWRIKPTYDPFEGDWSDTGVFQIVANLDPPTLSGASVTPSSGYPTTDFVFSIIYSDVNGDPPEGVSGAYIRVVINGTPYDMVKSYPSDNNYKDGCLYNKTIQLPAIGTYEYFFECNDSVYYKAMGNYTGPVVADPNQHPPVLVDPKVTPMMGNSSIVYNFSVIYFDEDGDLPPLAQYINITINSTTYQLVPEDVADVDPTDGKTYYVSLALSEDPYAYQFYINASDGKYSVSTSTFEAPLVNPFYNTVIDLRAPANNTYLVMGNYNFSWSSLELLVGNTNYTLEISSKADFSTVVMHVDDIVETTGTTSLINASINFTNGIYYWRVRACSGADYIGPWSDYHVFILVTNLSKPSLSNPSLLPETDRHAGVEFNFSVTYTDQDGNYPEYINVVINDTAFPMAKIDPSDADHTDGCQYEWLGYLEPGSYEYYFECADITGKANTTVMTLIVSEPVKPASTEPETPPGQEGPTGTPAAAMPSTTTIAIIIIIIVAGVVGAIAGIYVFKARRNKIPKIKR
ncbi:MAG: hypothetical protein ACTSWN_08795 [Promethearchaeota archaeon]